MIEVLISWIFIGITAYVTGFFLVHILCGMLGIDSRAYDSAVSHPHVLRTFFGLCAVNVMAQTASLFGGVGLIADLVLIFFCVVSFAICRKELTGRVHLIRAIKQYPYRTITYVLLVCLFAYGTSRGYMHFDTNLYHAQAIRWIEEYGVVPGLANIQSRFGYNSAEFALNAIYGFKWLLGRSLHTTAGFFMLLSSFAAMDIYKAFGRDEGKILHIQPRISDYIRMGLIFYLGLIFSDMVSPASDNYAGVMVYVIIILWLDIVEAENSAGYDRIRLDVDDGNGIDHINDTNVMMALRALLCILIVYAVTIKLSLAPLILLALVPGIYWIRRHDHKSIIVCMLSGLIIAIPYSIRGHIISGWILYPSTLISIGSPDWQLPKGMAQYDAREISMWGRGITEASRWESTGIVDWIPAWWHALAFMEKMWVLATAVALIYILAMTINTLFTFGRSGPGRSYIALMCTVAAGTVFWFISAPLIRYGYPYLIILPLLCAGHFLLIDKKIHRIETVCFTVLFIGICLIRVRGLVQDITRTVGWQNYVNQQDYIDGDADSYEIDGITVYVAKDAGQIGYYKIPSTVEERHDFSLRGEDLADGFRHRD